MRVSIRCCLSDDIVLLKGSSLVSLWSLLFLSYSMYFKEEMCHVIVESCRLLLNDDVVAYREIGLMNLQRTALPDNDTAFQSKMLHMMLLSVVLLNDHIIPQDIYVSGESSG